MRSLLFRETVAIDTATVVVFTKDFDGMTPITITVENEDVKAKVTTSDRWGSMDSKLVFEWATGGTGGNAKTVTIVEDTADRNGAAHAVVSDDFTLTIGANVLAWQVVALLAEDLLADGMTVRLADESDGVAPVIPPRVDDSDDELVYELAGGLATATTGAATVEIASNTESSFVADSTAATALGTVAEGTPKSHTFTPAPVRVVRYSLAMGATPASVTVSARVSRTA